jgi:hypothetical protein
LKKFLSLCAKKYFFKAKILSKYNTHTFNRYPLSYHSSMYPSLIKIIRYPKFLTLFIFFTYFKVFFVVINDKN